VLIPVRQWIRTTFPQGGRPTLRKVQEWFAAGHVAGRYFGDDLYIDDSASTPHPAAVQRSRARIDVLA